MANIITISLSPNTERDDILLALNLIIKPWLWKLKSKKTGDGILEKEFKRYLNIKYAFAFNSGRSGLLAILDSLNLDPKDEVLIQAFTCNAVPNPILWKNLAPVYVDCDEETLNMSAEDLEKKITSKSRAVIIQHTFGLPAEIDKIIEICRRNNLILIEDCAHSLGAEYKDSKVGTFGDAAFFSFGRDKIISSIYGGMVVTNNLKLAEKIEIFQRNCAFPSSFWIFQQLLHPIVINCLVLPLYGFFGLGKYFLLFLQKIKILSKAVQKKEKQGKRPIYFPLKMPMALEILALNQFKKLNKFLAHQKKIAGLYEKNLQDSMFILPRETVGRVYMRYSVLLKKYDTSIFLRLARKQGILLDDGWRKTSIVPMDTNQHKMGYILNSCPRAEKIAQSIINLPTHINISTRKAQKIINLLKNYGNPGN